MSSTERRASRRRSRGRANLLALSLLGLCLVVSPQLLGGAYGWGVAIAALLAGMACAAAAWSAHADGSKASLDGPSAMFLVLFAWTVLQTVALPRAITELAQPDAVAMADATAKLIPTEPPSWIPLSLSPGSTRAEVVKGAAIVASFLAAWLLAALGQRRRVAQLVALSTLTMALVALGHLAADAERVFGLYAPRETGGYLLAPLLNGNHLSGFLSLGVPLAIGLALDEEEPGKRLAYLAGAAVIGATALLAVSRGGVAGLACGLLALGALGLLRRRRRGAREVRTVYATLGAAVAAIAGLGLYVGAEALYRKFERGDMSKLELGSQGLALALEHPLIGVGRGAFSAAFVTQHGSNVRFTHPENLLAQWTSEWGLIAALALFGVLGWAMVRSMAAARSWTRLGAAAGAIAIVVHDLVDFALEMSGVAVVAAALSATAIAPHRGSRAVSRARSLRAWHAAAAVSALALLVSATLGPRLDRGSAEALRAELIELMDDGPGFRATLLEALRLHPAEPVFPLLAGARAVRESDERAMHWLNRAMVLAPGWASPHVEAARLLAQRGRFSQALLELREADERQLGSSARLTCALLQQRPEMAAELVRINQSSPVAIERLDRVARCLPLAHEATVAIDAHLVEEGARPARVRSALRLVEADDGPGALSMLEPIEIEADLDVQLARARALIACEEHGPAARVLEAAESLADRPDRLLGVLLMAARARAAAEDAEGMRKTLERARDRVGGRAGQLASTWLTQGQLEERLGNGAAALAAYHRAHRLDPSSAGLSNVARLTERTGDLASALRAHAELCRVLGESSPHCASRDRLTRLLSQRPPSHVQPSAAP